MNTTDFDAPPDEESVAWYRAADVADAHADATLWNRDLAVRAERGQVDLPRLREAGVRLQIFTVATRGFPLIDGMGLFCAWRGYPRRARRRPRDRALHQIELLRGAVERSGKEASLVTTREELDAALASGRLAAILGLEGAAPLEGRVESLGEFADLGVRVLGPSHLIPNEFASCSFWAYRDRGLSPLGRELLGALARARVALDLAHASPRAIDDALAAAPPDLAVFDSHTGAMGARPHWRNLSDAHVRAIASRGGVVAVILASLYLGGRSLGEFARHARHVAAVGGDGVVALGSDFDGLVAMPRGIRDVTDLPRVAAALRRGGFARDAALGALGGNLIGFLRCSLPTALPSAR